MWKILVQAKQSLITGLLCKQSITAGAGDTNMILVMYWNIPVYWSGHNKGGNLSFGKREAGNAIVDK